MTEMIFRKANSCHRRALALVSLAVLLAPFPACASPHVERKTKTDGDFEEIRIDFSNPDAMSCDPEVIRSPIGADFTETTLTESEKNATEGEGRAERSDDGRTAAQKRESGAARCEDDVNRIVEYPFRDGNVYEVRVGTKTVTDIRLESGETPSGPMAIGDPESYAVESGFSTENGARVVHLFVRALGNGGWTTAIVTTDRRTYYLKFVNSDENAMFGVRFRHSSNIALRQTESDRRSLTDLRDLDFDYKSGGDEEIRPVRAFSDSRSTYIQFAASFVGSMLNPALYVRNGKTLSVINYTVRGNMYIADFLLGKKEKFVLMLDGKEAEVSRL